MGRGVDAEPPVQHDAQRVASAADAARQPRVVGPDGLRADEHRVHLVAQGVDPPARRRTADPARVPAGGGDASVERRCEFQRHERAAGPHPDQKIFVDLPARGAQHAGRHRHAGPPQAPDPAAAYARVRVGQADHHAPDAGFDQRVGARRGTAVVGAGFQIDIDGRPAHRLTRGAQRFDFGVRPAGAPVMALADRAVPAHDHRADRRVRTRAPPAAGGQLERAAHERLVAAHDAGFPAAGLRPGFSAAARSWVLRSRIRSLSSDMNSSRSWNER